jgi:hypothetical protein
MPAAPAEQRTEGVDREEEYPAFPWYDSIWLRRYARAKKVIERVRPEMLPEFEDAFRALRTRPDFKVKELSQVLSDSALGELEQVIRGLKASDLERHELDDFGRFIVHDHPFVTELQHSIVDLASEAAGEPVDPCYNFVSLYTKLGVCPVHMDAPNAKWTLDLCVRQSEPWPIHLSQVVPWPEQAEYDRDDWDELIKQDPANRFEPYSLEPGSAIFFSGSSQWHYRDPHPGDGKDQFCDLVFFHFVPRGMGEKVRPENWARLFGIPELAEPRPSLLRRLKPGLARRFRAVSRRAKWATPSAVGPSTESRSWRSRS